MNEPYDGRADVYSVGVMMFETLCGRLPFQTSGPGGYWSAAMLNPLRAPPAPHEIEPSVPAELEAAIVRAMAMEPSQRPTAAELELHLRRFLESEEVVRAV